MFNIVRKGVVRRGKHGVNAFSGIFHHHIGGFVHHIGVITQTAGQGIGPCAAGQHIIAIVAGDGIVQVIASAV